jgi:hypothetical protein
MGVEMLLSMSQWPPLTCERSKYLNIPYDPFPAFTYIVIITTGADSVNDEGTDLLDARERSSRTHDGL